MFHSTPSFKSKLTDLVCNLSLLIDTSQESQEYVFKRFPYQVAIYSRGSSVLDWRIVAGGNLPTGRTGLRVVKVGDLLYALGGRERANNNRDLTTILSWDPVGERWNPAGYLSIGRSAFAAVALPSGLIQC